MSGVHARIAGLLREAWERGEVIRITWVNHYSAQVLLDREPTLLEQFDLVGVDGVLLQTLLRSPYARIPGGGDATLPLLLPSLRGARVALVGGLPQENGARRRAVERLLGPSSVIVASSDGYEGRPRADELPAWLERHSPDVVIVGMGAGLQDVFALEVARLLDRGVVATCGGWMDQIAGVGTYYPHWAYRARLTWAVRLLREPHRLWRRYSIDAFTAVHRRSALTSWVASSPGYIRYCDVAGGGVTRSSK